MSEGRAKHGGARPRAGRKSKAEEAGLKELLDECVTREERKQLFNKLKEKALNGEDFSIQLLLAYLYGKPVQPNEEKGKRVYRIEYGDDNPTS